MFPHRRDGIADNAGKSSGEQREAGNASPMHGHRGIGMTPAGELSRRSFLGLAGGAAATGLLAACSGDISGTNGDRRDPKITLDALRTEYSAKIGLSVFDHSRQKEFDDHGDTESYEASVVKVPIALSVMRQAAEHGGKIDDDQRELIRRSVEQSDNEATAELFSSLADNPSDTISSSQNDREALSANAINLTYTRLGVQYTRSAKTWDDNTTCSADQVQVARGLVDGVDWVHPDDMAYLRTLMSPEDESQGWGVGSMKNGRAGNKQVRTVEVKNGWLPNDDGTWNITSMGAVFTDDAAYSVAVVSVGFESFEEGQKIANQAVKTYFDAL